MLKRLMIVNMLVLMAAMMLTITSLSFANNLVELGFLTGVHGRKVLSIPFSGGIGVGVVNLMPIAGVLLINGSAIYAATGITWGNDSNETESS